MKCRLCLEEADLCRSHVIPEFLYSELYDGEHRFVEMYDVTNGKVRMGQKGYRERLLCPKCETHINHFEKHTRRLFVDPLPALTSGSSRFREHVRLDYSLTKLFFLSVLWRASISTLPVFKHVSLGTHEEKIRNMIYGQDPGADSLYPVALFALQFEGRHFRDFMVEPTYMRIEGRRYYRFVMAGFVVFAFVSSSPAPAPFSRLCISPYASVKSFDSDLSEFRFLREVWDRAARQR